MKKIGCLVYKLNISPNWRIAQVFSVAQLKLAPPPAEDFFVILFLFNPLFIFIKDNIDKIKSFEREKLVIKYQVKKGKNQAIEY